MPIASYQGKAFTVSSTKQYTLNSLEWAGSLDTESQEKVQDKPSTYIKGLGLRTMTFEIPLRADLGVDVRLEIEAWEAIRDKTKPDIFILGSKPMGRNKWLLKSVAVSDTLIDADGYLLRASVKLELEEYVRAGSAAASKAAGGGAVSSGLSPRPTIYSPTDKAEQKRDNPNTFSALREARQRELVL